MNARAVLASARPGGPAPFLPLGLLLGLAATLALAAWSTPVLAGQALEPGLELIFFDPDDGRELSAPETQEGLSAVDLVIDPARFDFTLLCASSLGQEPHSPPDWAKGHGLSAVINAGMYQKDGLASTGLLKTRGKVNNPKVNNRFGAFFVFDPLEPGLTPVTILERPKQDLPPELPKYASVVQNYRMITSRGENLWPPADETVAVAAVAVDEKGRVHFLHSARPMAVHDFNETLLGLPVNLVTAMYVEGGPQAALFLNTPARTGGWGGSLTGSFRPGADARFWPLPNVLGIKRKGAPAKP